MNESSNILNKSGDNPDEATLLCEVCGARFVMNPHLGGFHRKRCADCNKIHDVFSQIFRDVYRQYQGKTPERVYKILIEIVDLISKKSL